MKTLLFPFSLFNKEGRISILLNGTPNTGPLVSLLERHGVTEILFTIGYPAAIKTDKLGLLSECLYFLKLLIARQNTDMTGMISTTNLFRHFSSPLPIEFLRRFSISVFSSSPAGAWALNQ